MTVELFFVAGSFVVGVGQVVEAWIIRRDGGEMRAPMAAFSLVEFAWAAFSAYLLVTGRLEFARWLAIMFLAGIPLAIVIGILADPKVFTREPEEIRVPKAAALFGGVFGALFATTALFLLAA